ncbi:helix-turn-helix domain-containing protein [Streptomyces sp. NPDC017448]|uniref:helix-turn-helix domain-containing protein n=1 Tax=Streptomyces sp. NPDC017448 TaxID=3364996 RepID=UPI0037B07876
MKNEEMGSILVAVGERLRALRHERRATLDDISDISGISPSTLSRLESGQRKYTLDLLLPLAAAYNVPLDELVGAPPTGDPRIHLRPASLRQGGRTVIPLVRHYGGPHAHKHVLPVDPRAADAPELNTHQGFNWIYVLYGRLRITAGSAELVLKAGEAAEFDTSLPHAFSNAGDQPAEFLSLFGAQGERMRVLDWKGVETDSAHD